ncbi:MAG: Bifunctional primase/polymerase [Schlesneria sp.]|nr:Bifunctional primase/polymerase [Schlesneria sp.]
MDAAHDIDQRFVRHPDAGCRMKNLILDEALRLHSLELSVIPIGRKKKPALRAWKRFQNIAADENQIRDWFAGRDDLGLAIVMGFASGHLVVRDFDDTHSYDQWKKANPRLAKVLPTVRTGRGFHVYARIRECRSVTFDDGELRAIGNYVVAPPSVHSSGRHYRWVQCFGNLADVPILTLEDSGFGREWGITEIAKARLKYNSNATDKTEIDSVQSVLSVAIKAELIATTLPVSVGTRRKRLFRLACRIRADPEWSKIPLRQLKPLVQDWHRQALPTIQTKSFDETWADFVEAFGNVDLSRCVDVPQEAMKRAAMKELPPEAGRYDSPLTRRLTALCAELSGVSSDGVFFLSCRKAAEVMGITDHKLIARIFKMLCADGVLNETEHGGPHTNRASRYRYLRGGDAAQH